MEAVSQLASGGITDLGAIGEAALEGAILAAVVPSAAAGSIGRLLNAAKRLKTKPKAGDGAKKTHGNSKASTKEQHLYMINDADGNIKKIGVSGQKHNKNGTSPSL